VIIRRRFLFAFSGRGAFEQFLDFAAFGRSNGHFDSIFWSAGTANATLLDKAAAEGYELFDLTATNAHQTSSERGPTRLEPEQDLRGSRSLSRSLSSIWLVKQIISAVRYALAIGRQRRLMRALLKRLPVSAVITSDERSPTFLPLLAEARRMSVPIVLLPPNYLCMPDGGATMRRANRELLTAIPWRDAWHNGEFGIALLNGMTARLLPRQVFDSYWGGMFCYPARDLIGLALAGVLPRNIWYQGTRYASRVVISGDEEVAVCRRAGVPETALVKLGSPVFEMLNAHWGCRTDIRFALAREFGFDPGRKIVVFAIPVGWEHKMISREAQFEVLEGTFPILRRPTPSGAELPVILLSLHPKSRRADYEVIAAQNGAFIVDRSLSEFLAAADVFVAGAYSSTMRWALALGIPAVNLDFWEMKESTYDGFPDFETVRTFQALQNWYTGAMQRIAGHARLSPMPLGLMVDQGFYQRMQTLIETELSQ
jgi:hypothetical protein